MTEPKSSTVWNVTLPWSDGSLSAKLWQKGKRVIVGVPELDIFCTGKTQSEATFRLFSTLLKYYQELKATTGEPSQRQAEHMALLKGWVQSVQDRMTQRELTSVP